ncbi:hypothetical protein CCR75_009153 [Bremia lactucae]|uniref:Serine/threonine-protein phosphatase 4 regulatory subunit 3-like central domain-containing protein n=1 Tax=Bremia lactucae TaxID=4779 RepID=A0A976FKH1_BRELC|nr:hypothetical protein CCR75_009153 [Bremia lactucae]
MEEESGLDQLFSDELEPLIMRVVRYNVSICDLPPCDIDHLDEILLCLTSSYPNIRSMVQLKLADKDGAYIVRLLDLFDVSELDADKSILHKLFKVFYAMPNFISVVGVFGYNPGLIREMDFRTVLEGDGGFREVRLESRELTLLLVYWQVIPITDQNVVERVHMNFRIQVIKDNVLSRLLPDGCVLLLEYMMNENNFHILSFISETEIYWKAIKKLVSNEAKRLEGLGLLKAIINMVRVTKPLDRPQSRDAFAVQPLFSALVDNLFGDGELYAAFAAVLGLSDSNSGEAAIVMDILTVLVVYQSPEKLRSYLATEGKCIPAPASDKDRITWTVESSLFTALLVVFERDETLRIQVVNLLREIFSVPLGQDDKFLSVLYPNYMHWLLQPLKTHAFIRDASAMFNLQDSIMELLTFCTENHGYRVKYLFGRQPVATYAAKMLRSHNKLFVIHGVKFIRACAVRAEAFFSRFLIQNDLFTPMLANLEIGKPNNGALCSAIFEVLSLIEKTNLTSLIEHVFTKFYEIYKEECSLVFEAIRARYDGKSGLEDAAMTRAPKPQLVRSSSFDAEEELYFESDSDVAESSPGFAKNCLSEEEVSCQNRPRSVKLVDYDDDELAVGEKLDIPIDLVAMKATRYTENEEEREFKLPVRAKVDEADTNLFLGGSSLISQKKAQHSNKPAQLPQFKNVFQKISWKHTSPNSSSNDGKMDTYHETKASNDAKSNDQDESSSGCAGIDGAAEIDGESLESAALLAAKREIDSEDAAYSESLLKKAKTFTPISSS